jgi:hypothetical protein
VSSGAAGKAPAPPWEVAVLLLHGVEARDPGYAENAMRLLRRELVRATGDPDVGRRVHVERAYWVPAVAAQQDRLVAKVFPPPFRPWVRWLNGLVPGSETAPARR